MSTEQPLSASANLAAGRPGAARDALAGLRAFGWRGWAVSGLVAVLTLVAIGIPTEIIANPFFRRMTEVRPQDYVIWAATGALAGLIAGSFVAARGGGAGKLMTGGFLSYLAVGCPVCNKVVVLLLGTSGALTLFGPSQLYIGAASVALLVLTLWLRLVSIGSPCPVPAPGRQGE